VEKLVTNRRKPVLMEHYYQAQQHFLTERFDKNIINIVQKAREKKPFMLRLLFDNEPVAFTVDNPDTYERFLYYQCSAIATNYKFPVTIITLVFFTEKNNPDSGILVHDMEPRDFISGRVIDKVYNRKHKLFFKVKAL
jgi:hypothetical protein